MDKSWRNIGIGAGLGAVAGVILWKLKRPVIKYDCPRPDTSLALIGDSFAVGLKYWIGVKAKGCGVPFESDARSGTSVIQWQADTWIGPVLEQHPSVVLISLGGNDFFWKPEKLQAAIDKLVDRIRSTGARVLWIEPHHLPFPEKSGVRQLWKDKVGNDWFASWNLPYKKASDGVHLYPAGYKAWAEEIWPWLSAKTHEIR